MSEELVVAPTELEEDTTEELLELEDLDEELTALEVELEEEDDDDLTSLELELEDDDELNVLELELDLEDVEAELAGGVGLLEAVESDPRRVDADAADTYDVVLGVETQVLAFQ